MGVTSIVANCDNVPFGWANSPFSTPDFNALLKSESNILSVALMLLLALTYFFRATRLEGTSVIVLTYTRTIQKQNVTRKN